MPQVRPGANGARASSDLVDTKDADVKPNWFLLGRPQAVQLAWMAVLVGCVGLLTGRAARAQEPTLFSGTWTETLGLDLAAEDPQEDVGVLRSRLDLDIRHPVSERLRVRLAGRLAHRAQVGHHNGVPDFQADFPAFGARYDAHADLREAYLQWQLGDHSLTVGRDTAVWGALQLQSPWQVVTPMDYSLGLAGAVAAADDPLALPDWLVRWQTPLGPGRLEAIYLPFFSQHRFSPFATDAAFVRPGFGPDLPASLAPFLRRMDLRLDRSMSESLMLLLNPPPATPLDGSVGARWTTTVGPAELTASALYNYDRVPVLRLDQDMLQLFSVVADSGFDFAKLASAFSDPALQDAAERSKGKQLTDLAKASWQRRLVVGGSASVQVGEALTLRSDVAFSHKRVLMDRQFVPLRSALLQVGAGAEWQEGDWLVALAEVTWDRALDVPDGKALFLSAKDVVRAAAGAVLRLGETQDWTLQLGGFYGVTLGDWAAAPRLTWAFAEGWKAAAAAILVDGPRQSPGGLQRTDDQLLLEVRRDF